MHQSDKSSMIGHMAATVGLLGATAIIGFGAEEVIAALIGAIFKLVSFG